jgi:hypothetical protein
MAATVECAQPHGAHFNAPAARTKRPAASEICAVSLISPECTPLPGLSKSNRHKAEPLVQLQQPALPFFKPDANSSLVRNVASNLGTTKGVPPGQRMPVSHEMIARVVRLAHTVTLTGEHLGNIFAVSATTVYEPTRSRRR